MDKEGWQQNNQGMWKCIEVYTNGYSEAEKERMKGTEMEKRRGTRGHEMMETKVQAIVAGLGIVASLESRRDTNDVEELNKKWGLLKRRYLFFPFFLCQILAPSFLFFFGKSRRKGGTGVGVTKKEVKQALGEGERSKTIWFA